MMMTVTDSRVPDLPVPVPPAELAQQMASMWRQALKVDQLEADDNFFQLGGQSIVAARLIAMVSDATGVKIRLKVLYQNPTVARFTAWLAAQQADGATPPDADPR